MSEVGGFQRRRVSYALFTPNSILVQHQGVRREGCTVTNMQRLHPGGMRRTELVAGRTQVSNSGASKQATLEDPQGRLEALKLIAER